MICPYCGQFISEKNKEHFFPQMIKPNDWDFYACRECNRLKGQHIVYPKGELFRLRPRELSIEKFDYLWRTSGNIKYLNIVPVSKMIKVFNERKWTLKDSLFSIEERQYYGLDRLKEIYQYYTLMTNARHEAIALVMSSHFSHLYYVHEFSGNILSPYPEVRPINVQRFVAAHLEGWLMCGSTREGLWRTVQPYSEYFKTLLGAPYSKEMLSGGILNGISRY